MNIERSTKRLEYETVIKSFFFWAPFSTQSFEIIRNGDNASFTMTRGLYLSKLEEKIDFAAKIPIS